METFKKKFFITKKNLTLPKIIDDALITAEEQDSSLGLSQKYLQKKNMAWVTTKYFIHVYNFPNLIKYFWATSVPTVYNRFLAYRNLNIFNPNREKIVEIKSEWTLIDLKKRRMMPIPKFIINKYINYNPQIKKGISNFPRIKKPQGVSLRKNYYVKPSDIDTNGHVHNTKYIDWILAPYDKKYKNGNFSIKYIKEVHLGETVKIESENKIKEDKLLVRTRILSEKGKSVAEANFIFQK